MPALSEAPYLKPCPFCGCEIEAKWNRKNPSARCVTPDCWGAKLPTVLLDYPEQIEAWNTRPQEAALVWLSQQEEQEIKENCTTVACVLKAVKAKLCKKKGGT